MNRDKHWAWAHRVIFAVAAGVVAGLIFGAFVDVDTAATAAIRAAGVGGALGAGMPR